MVKSLNSENTFDKNSGRWTVEEHEKFVHARSLKMKWDDIAKYIGTRNTDQCRSHYQKIKDKSSNYRGSGVLMKDKGTQYEAPASFYASKDLFLLDSECSSPGTKASDDGIFFEDFQITSDDVCEDLLTI